MADCNCYGATKNTYWSYDDICYNYYNGKIFSYNNTEYHTNYTTKDFNEKDKAKCGGSFYCPSIDNSKEMDCIEIDKYHKDLLINKQVVRLPGIL